MNYSPIPEVEKKPVEMDALNTVGWEIKEYRELRRGDHIAVIGDNQGIEYFHHGIFLGGEIGVAEFSGTNMRNAKLQVTDIMTFYHSGNRSLVRVMYDQQDCREPEKVAKTAEDFVDRRGPFEWGSYNMLTNNCEHFAVYCKTGRMASKQVLSQIKEAIRNPMPYLRYIKESISSSCSSCW